MPRISAKRKALCAARRQNILKRWRKYVVGKLMEQQGDGHVVDESRPGTSASLSPAVRRPTTRSAASSRHKDYEPACVQAKKLRSPTVPTRRLVEAGCVFAVHEVEGLCRYARISLEGDQLYLHVLKELPLPHGATTLQVSKVMPPSPPCFVFLDLSWPGSMAPRRVQIHLSRDIPAARQFMLLCTGQRGASYAHSRMLDVLSKGEDGECVVGGDYERNDGEGGAGLMPYLYSPDFCPSRQAGSVLVMWLSDPAKCAQFAICTRNLLGVSKFSHVFGEVVDGLHVLLEAARHDNITDVTVVDCGVVLWCSVTKSS